MQIVVLCAGKATRLYPLTKKIPKSMIRVCGKPFLEHQIELFRKNKIFDVVLCIGFLGEQIEEYFGDGKSFGVSIKYSREKEPIDTGTTLKNAKKLLNDEFFVIYGDSYLLNDYQEAYNYFKKFNKLGLMTIYKNYEKLEANTVIAEGNFIKKFDKENPNQPGMIYTEFGLNIFKKKVLDSVRKKAFPIGDYFKKLIEKKELLAFETPKRFYEIGSPNSLKETSDFIKSLKKS